MTQALTQVGHVPIKLVQLVHQAHLSLHQAVVGMLQFITQ
jgi:hypothetical protein